jgi:pimeloyl-ACP methyl ester carboxylesterase
MATATTRAELAGASPAPDEPPSRRDRSRARYPDLEAFAERDGVRIWYEVYGHGEPTTVLVPTWQIIHSRLWKAQIPYLARQGRVVTFDPRGNGRSDRPSTPDGYAVREMAADILTVMDATETDRAVLVTLSAGTARALVVASEHPERVAGLVAIAPSLAIGERLGERRYPFDEVLDTDERWAKDNIHYWRRDFEGYLEFFFSRCFTELHSTKQIEDCVGWGLEIGAETLALGEDAAVPGSPARCSSWWATRTRSPAWVPGLPSARRSPTGGSSCSRVPATSRMLAIPSSSTC